jgi:hypothetical protein
MPWHARSSAGAGPVRLRRRAAALLLVAGTAAPVPVAAQDAAAGGVAAVAAARTAAGTAWQPERTPMAALHGTAGAWRLMLHGAASVGYVREASPKGGSQVGSANWMMLSAERRAGTGTLVLTVMGSLETVTLGACGLPRLLAVSGTCDTDGYSDYQHPHPPVMELSARYIEPLGPGMGLELFGAFAGQPALGPPGRAHRLSAAADPIAPISEHDLDPAHVSGGVLTAGVFSPRWKVEASVFNGAAVDPDRVLPDLGPLSSYAARATYNPSPGWSVQVSAGRISAGGGGHHAGAGEALRVATATASHHRPIGGRALSATTVGYGYMDDGTLPRHTVLLESALTIGERHTFFARAEAADRVQTRLTVIDGADGSHDHTIDAFGNRVGQLSGGYVLSARLGRALVGIGARGSISFLSDDLEPVYQQPRPLGGAVYISVRPWGGAGDGHHHTDG